MLRGFLLTFCFGFMLAGCATTPEGSRPPGEQRCESFFIYVLCVADLDRDRLVDYMYFDDTREIFMFAQSMHDALKGILPFHRCAIPMGNDTRKVSSTLLYGGDLSFTEKLALKGRLIKNYRAAQPAISACNKRAEKEQGQDARKDDPFTVDEDWTLGES